MGILRWIATVALAGCATASLETVPESDWNTVPLAERTKLDTAYGADRNQAQAELRAATTAVDHARALAAVQPARKKPAASDDDARARAEALGRVDSANAERAHAELVWRERRLDEATLRLAVIDTQREVDRAHAVDRSMTGDDYQVAPYRGQLAQAQVKWYSASERSAAARADLERASADVASAKEAFAQLVRGDGDQIAAAERALRLPGWSTEPTETGHRRGLVFVRASAPLALHQRGFHRTAIAPLLR